MWPRGERTRLITRIIGAFRNSLDQNNKPPASAYLTICQDKWGKKKEEMLRNFFGGGLFMWDRKHQKWLVIATISALSLRRMELINSCGKEKKRSKRVYLSSTLCWEVQIWKSITDVIFRLWTAVMLTQSGEHHTQKTRRFKKEAHSCWFSTGIDFFKSFTVSPFASKRDSSAFCDLWYYRF